MADSSATSDNVYYWDSETLLAILSPYTSLSWGQEDHGGAVALMISAKAVTGRALGRRPYYIQGSVRAIKSTIKRVRIVREDLSNEF